jgi:hypothetical protein
MRQVYLGEQTFDRGSIFVLIASSLDSLRWARTPPEEALHAFSPAPGLLDRCVPRRPARLDAARRRRSARALSGEQHRYARAEERRRHLVQGEGRLALRPLFQGRPAARGSGRTRRPAGPEGDKGDKGETGATGPAGAAGATATSIFAAVRSDGTLIGYKGIVANSHEGTGYYRLVFNPDMSKCAIVATTLSSSFRVAAQPNGAAANQILIHTREAATNNHQDAYFSIALFC